jgi:hypothetical protein
MSAPLHDTPLETYYESRKNKNPSFKNLAPLIVDPQKLQPKTTLSVSAIDKEAASAPVLSNSNSYIRRISQPGSGARQYGLLRTSSSLGQMGMSSNQQQQELEHNVNSN